jgi:cellulose synthase/poly-beta-1,6-N-acetylglucosamine synthase-like glycosyltransferase
VPWEVIIVDNCCTDGTAAFAMKAWPKTAPAPLRVVLEPAPGKTRAFERGFEEAAYDFMCVVDDDNWVCQDWVKLVAEVMTSDPQIGICGGPSEGVFEAAPPPWFATFGRAFAVGEVSSVPADITWTRGYIWGAGQCVRKQAWRQLREQGFRNELSCRCGTQLTSGSDGELCRAMRLAGWKLYYDPRLRIQHYMPSGRLNWPYLRQLQNGLGVASVTIDAYNFAAKRNKWGISKLIKENWAFQMFCTLLDLARCGPMAFSAKKRAREGSDAALKAEFAIGRLNALWQSPGDYRRRIQEVRHASWRTIQSAPVCQT